MPTALALMAHPDDIEILCAGTLLLLKRAGWTVHMATMTAGDLGSMTLPRDRISRIRRAEAAAAAKVLGGDYTCLGFRDLTIMYGERAKQRVTELMRKVKPDLLISHSPDDYMGDHVETPRLAREAAFASTIPNWRAGRSKPCASIPAILYADPVENIDMYGRRVPARIVVDITEVMPLKERMLACHESQRSWLRVQHGEDEYIQSMKRWSADRGRDAGVEYAEGFMPHLGHGFPKTDYLSQALGPKVTTLGEKR
jgi:LmbE family N-acetylglucosaminyl deacetylase